MNHERAPGELDALSNGYLSDDVKIQTIKENLRARQQAPDYTGYLTEEEADFLFGAIEDLQEEVTEANLRAEQHESDADDVRQELEEAKDAHEDAVKDLEDQISALNATIETLTTPEAP
jgi:chromosome segregation ATPase